MQPAGLVFSERQIVEGDWSSASGEKGLKKLLKQYPQMDAVFISNDRMALGAMKAARELGLRIPHDLAMVGYDDVPESGFFAPTLTTVRQDLREPASLAISLVDQMIIEAGRDEKTIVPKTHLFPPQLIIRKSSPKEGNELEQT